MAHVEFNETYAAASRASQYSHTHTHTHTRACARFTGDNKARLCDLNFRRFRSTKRAFAFSVLHFVLFPNFPTAFGKFDTAREFLFHYSLPPRGGRHEFAKIGFFVRLYRVIMFLAKIKIFFFFSINVIKAFGRKM